MIKDIFQKEATGNLPEYHLVCFSGGKDSTAMLLRMMELGMPIDEVLYCDVYMEFPAMYEHIEKVRKIVVDNGIKFTTLRNEHGFEYYLLDYMRIRGKRKGQMGCSWARTRYRWCTDFLKIRPMKKHKAQFKSQYQVFEYVGIAADEQYRLQKKI